MTSYNSRNKIYIGISGTILRETDKAIHLSYFDTELQKNVVIWLPISQCAHIVRATAEDSEAKSVLMVAEWVLDKAGCMHERLTPEEQGKLNEYKLKSEGALKTPAYKSGTMKTNKLPDEDDIPF